MRCACRRIKPRSARIFRRLPALTFLGFLAANHSGYAGGPAKNGAQIEYIAPDGQFSSLTATHPAHYKQTAAFVDTDTISCVLKEGETTFIIELPNNAPRDRLTFLNENADACGELRIAVSDSQLPADSCESETAIRSSPQASAFSFRKVKRSRGALFGNSMMNVVSPSFRTQLIVSVSTKAAVCL